MMHSQTSLKLALLLAALCSPTARAQNPTAIQRMQLSAFGGVSPVFTGLGGGKNFSITAGVDLALPTVHHIRPTLEVRGTHPADHGLVDSQKSVLGGLRADFLLGRRFHPYGDFLFGRGQMNYGFGYPYNGSYYVLTTTYVYSPGAGIDFDISDNLGIKLDGQYQHWSGPAPTPSGTIYSTVATAALVYRFNFNRHGLR